MDIDRKRANTQFLALTLLCVFLLFGYKLSAQILTDDMSMVEEPDLFCQSPVVKGALANPLNMKDLEVYVDEYPPYISAPNDALGSAAKILDTLGKYSDTQIRFSYLSYLDAERLMLLGKNAVAYPYFFTSKRAESYYFSCGVALASIEIYYSRQFNALEDIVTLEGLTVGVVAGNSYGKSIDERLVGPIEYDTEINAIVALMDNKIDVLPMAKGVMDSFIKTHFSAQRELLKPLANIRGKSLFRVMAPKNEFGLNAINLINHAIVQKFGKSGPNERSVEIPPKVDLAVLIPAEGFPAIIGKNLEDNNDYTLPIGTQVIVLDWSEGIRKPNLATSINRSMMLTSKVVILNGPHVSKEMMIRNMHIQLK